MGRPPGRGPRGGARGRSAGGICLQRLPRRTLRGPCPNGPLGDARAPVRHHLPPLPASTHSMGPRRARRRFVSSRRSCRKSGARRLRGAGRARSCSRSPPGSRGTGSRSPRRTGSSCALGRTRRRRGAGARSEVRGLLSQPPGRHPGRPRVTSARPAPPPRAPPRSARANRVAEQGWRGTREGLPEGGKRHPSLQMTRTCQGDTAPFSAPFHPVSRRKWRLLA